MSTPHSGWLAAGSLLFVSGAGWGAFNVVDVLAHEVSTVTEVFDADGVAVVEVDNDNGEITVTATDAEEIRIVARVSDGLRDTGNSYERSGDRLHIRGSCPNLGGTWCSVDYRIEVPASIALDIDASNGPVDVAGVLGPLTLDSDNGSVEVRGAEGPLTATSDNGHVAATGIRSERVTARSDNGSVDVVMVTAPQSVEAVSDNGSVEVVLPDTDDAYAVTARTDNGDVRNEVRTDPAGSRTIVARSDNGDVTVRYAD